MLLAFAIFSLLGLPSTPVADTPRPSPAWHDEMNTPLAWGLPGSANDPIASAESPGVLTLTMPQAAIGFPYSYQWGAVTRTVAIDTVATPLLVARVTRMSDGGYAHLDIEMRDYAGNVVKGARSNTLQGKGFAVVNLREQFGAGLLRLTIRLIVGGQLSGAWCDYDYLRGMRPEEFTTLQSATATRKRASRRR